MMVKRSSDTFAKGMEGESEVKRILNNLEGVKYIENLYLETPNSTCQIDFIVISKKGIFVIEVKNITGTVLVNTNNSKWKVNTHSRNYSIINPILQNSRHILNLRKNISVDGIYHNVVVFSDKTNIINRTSEVMNFLDLYSIHKNKIDLLTDSDIKEIYKYLEQLKRTNMYLAVKHNRNAKKYIQ